MHMFFDKWYVDVDRYQFHHYNKSIEPPRTVYKTEKMGCCV